MWVGGRVTHTVPLLTSLPPARTCVSVFTSTGLVPEFVNPKYADATKTVFQKPTRLECMMQDLPRVLLPGARVGFVQLPEWTYSPVKNSLAEGTKKDAAGVHPRCASEGELEFYDGEA